MKTMDKFQTIKSLLNIPIEQDSMLDYVCGSVESKVRAYVNYTDDEVLPASLDNIILDIIVDQVKAGALEPYTNNSVTESTGVIKKKTISDVTIEYDNSTNKNNSGGLSTGFLNNYESLLKKYRRIVCL